MKYIYIATLIMVVSQNPSLSLASETASQSPVIMEEKTIKENSELLKQIQEDFKLVEMGKKPKFAKFDKDQPLLADGGTATYKGKGYSIIIQQSMGKLLGVDGYYYGPILKFEKEELNSSAKNISSVKFYSTGEFKLFKK